MTRTSLRLLLPLCLILSWGCAPDVDADDLPPDPEDSDVILEPGNGPGKEDGPGGIEEASYEGLCILNYVNQATRQDLLDVAHDIPAKEVWKHRVGADGLAGTEDDNPFETLRELDKVRWVGLITFGRFKSHALARASEFCPQMGQETVLPGEEDAALAIGRESVNFVTHQYDKSPPARRDAHAKSHGCVKAFVEVQPDQLPPEDRVGVFAQSQTYPAWIRFSNGGFLIKTDKKGDVRGLALKLMDVPGKKVLDRHQDALTQDFLFINGPAMFVRTPSDYVTFSAKAFDGNPVSFFLSLNPFDWKWRELTNVIRLTRKKPTNPLRNQYWSTTPYRLGDAKAVKYSLRPCDGMVEKGGWDSDDPDDLLRQNMADSLQQDEACFEFLVQRQLDPESTPIEDATIEWDEDAAPFVPVATVRIPAQTFDTPEQNQFCEDLAFNPWHTLPEHQPLGNVNRVRRVVYDMVSSVRHDLNGVEGAEPTSHELP